MFLILCLVPEVRNDLSNEAHVIRSLSPREYWEKLVAFVDQHVYRDMSDRHWRRHFGMNGYLKFIVGDGERDLDDPYYDKKCKLYSRGLRYARHKRRPGAFRSVCIEFPDHND